MPRPNARRSSPLSPPRSIRLRVGRFVREHRLVGPGQRVVVGLSGGPDSSCLLITLAALRTSLHFELHAAYFDHGLRGPRASSREERAVCSLADALQVPLACGSGDVRGYARKRRRSLEDAARKLRYGFFADVARAAGCDAAAVGHTRDDQAETVLLHLVRGSGLRGLAGMAPSSPWPFPRAKGPPRLIRPLLELSRTDTESCCREAGQVPIEDPSNRSRSNLRSRVRHELLPLMRTYNPRVDDALARLADAASEDVSMLEQMAAKALFEPKAQSGAVRLSRRRLGEMPPSLQRHAVRIAARSLLGDTRGLSDRHVLAVLRAAAGPTGGSLDLPRGIRVEVRRDAVALSLGGREASAPLPEGEVALRAPGRARFGRWRFRAELLEGAPKDPSTLSEPHTAYLDAAASGTALTLRRRRRGDRFQPLGMRQTKKLQDFFVDAHVPRGERDGVPLLCAERGIAWVVGQRPAEWAKVTPKTGRTLRLRATREPTAG